MFTFPYAPISICFIYPYAPIILSCVQTLQSCAYCSFVLFVLFSSLHQNLTFSQSPFQVVDVVKQVFFVEIEICPKLRFWINVSSDTIAYSEMAKTTLFQAKQLLQNCTLLKMVNSWCFSCMRKSWYFVLKHRFTTLTTTGWISRTSRARNVYKLVFMTLDVIVVVVDGQKKTFVLTLFPTFKD